MPYPHSDAIHWYYRVFLPRVQDHLLLPDRAADWSRLQIWTGTELKPVFPPEFSGHPSQEQIHMLYAHVQKSELFSFDLGDTSPTLWTENGRVTPEKNPVAPEKPALIENATTKRDLEANEKALQLYETAQEEYQALMRVKQNNGDAFWSAVEGYYAGRDLEQDRKEAAARKENSTYERYQIARGRADQVISEMMAPRPGVPADIFIKTQKQNSYAVIDYRHYENDLKPNGYDLPKNEKLNDYDAATINFAMLFVPRHMEKIIQAQGNFGPVYSKSSAENGVSMMITGLFGKTRLNQPLGTCLGEAMKLGKEAITDYLNNKPETLGHYLSESIKIMQKQLLSTGITTLTQDTVAGTSIFQRLLTLFDKNPDIWQATGLTEQDREFMRGYVQLGEVYDRFAKSHMKYVAAHTTGTALTHEEKVEILVDMALRRMIEKELAKEEKIVSESDEYQQIQANAVANDAPALAKHAQWMQDNAQMARTDPDGYATEMQRQQYLLDVNANMQHEFCQAVPHPIVHQLAQPGMRERMRQALIQDPFILKQANKSPLQFTVQELKAEEVKYTAKLDALIQNIQPSVDKATWFVNLQTMLVQGDNPTLAEVADRLVFSDGKKPPVSVASLLKGGLQNPDLKTLSELYQHAHNGNLYYYGKGQDMPARMNVDGVQTSAQTLEEPQRPSVWMRFANFITFGLAYSKVCKEADVFDFFTKARQTRAAAARNEVAAPQQEQPANEPANNRQAENKLWKYPAKDTRNMTNEEFLNHVKAAYDRGANLDTDSVLMGENCSPEAYYEVMTQQLEARIAKDIYLKATKETNIELRNKILDEHKKDYTAIVVGLGDYVFNHTDKNMLNTHCENPQIDSPEFAALLDVSNDLLNNAVDGYTAELNAHNAANEQHKQENQLRNEANLENDAAHIQKENNPVVKA